MNKVDRDHSRKQRLLQKSLRRVAAGNPNPRASARLGAHGRALEGFTQELKHPAGICSCLACRKARGEA